MGSSPHARGARSRTACRPCCSRDHPRMRGEHLTEDEAAELAERIIPACAGSTINPLTLVLFSPGSSPHARGARPSRLRSCPACQDHPRMRGEHSFCAIVSSSSAGSSPHARGALAAHSRSCSSRRDHPRMRGEHRGAGRGGPGRGGIIPACAGSTVDKAIGRGLVEDHPRMRGEHPRQILEELHHLGSSPHARGARTLPEAR